MLRADPYLYPLKGDEYGCRQNSSASLEATIPMTPGAIVRAQNQALPVGKTISLYKLFCLRIDPLFDALTFPIGLVKLCSDALSLLVFICKRSSTPSDHCQSFSCIKGCETKGYIPCGDLLLSYVADLFEGY